MKKNLSLPFFALLFCAHSSTSYGASLGSPSNAAQTADTSSSNALEVALLTRINETAHFYLSQKLKYEKSPCANTKRYLVANLTRNINELGEISGYFMTDERRPAQWYTTFLLYKRYIFLSNRTRDVAHPQKLVFPMDKGKLREILGNIHFDELFALDDNKVHYKLLNELVLLSLYFKPPSEKLLNAVALQLEASPFIQKCLQGQYTGIEDADQAGGYASVYYLLDKMPEAKQKDQSFIQRLEAAIKKVKDIKDQAIQEYKRQSFLKGTQLSKGDLFLHECLKNDEFLYGILDIEIGRNSFIVKNSLGRLSFFSEEKRNRIKEMVSNYQKKPCPFLPIRPSQIPTPSNKEVGCKKHERTAKKVQQRKKTKRTPSPKRAPESEKQKEIEKEVSDSEPFQF